MRFYITVPYCCVLLTLVLAASVSFAQENVGIVIASRGEVSVLSFGESRPLKQGDFIAVNNEIVTEGRSFAVFQFNDGSKVSLRPDSSFVVEQFSFVGATGDSATFKLISGGLKVVPGAIARSTPERFMISTASSLFMVSGSEGSLTLCGDEICDKRGVDEIGN